MSDQTIQVSLTQKQDYQFQVDFGGAGQSPGKQ